ncbi:MAG: tyrosine-protein phosphatase [Roseiflexaceae bacterium]
MFENIYQFRDIGGYVTVDGHTTVYNRFFRSSALYGMTSDDQRQVYDLGVRTVIDIRTTEEIIEQGETQFDVELDINLLHIPMVAQQRVLHELAAGSRSEALISGIEQVHPFFPKFFEIASSVNHGVVFHCSLGIVRTGLLTAILLDVAGVAHEEIVSDFSRTNIYLAPRLPILRQRRPTYLTPNQFEQLIVAHPQAMRDLLRYIYQTYGSMRDFLIRTGVPTQQIDQVVHRMITK